MEKEEKLAEEKKPEASDRTFYFLIAGIIIGIVVFSAVMFFSPKEAKKERLVYNNFVFEKIGGLWYTNWQKGSNVYIVSLRFNPKETEQVRVLGSLYENSTFNNRSIVHITFDPLGDDLSYVALAATELSLNLARALNVNVTAACIVNETIACHDRPIVNCNDTDKAVIFIKESPEPMMILTDSCMTLQGSGIELLRVVDRILYQWYGIMEDLGIKN